MDLISIGWKAALMLCYGAVYSSLQQSTELQREGWHSREALFVRSKVWIFLHRICWCVLWFTVNTGTILVHGSLLNVCTADRCLVVHGFYRIQPSILDPGSWCCIFQYSQGHTPGSRIRTRLRIYTELVKWVPLVSSQLIINLWHDSAVTSHQLNLLGALIRNTSSRVLSGPHDITCVRITVRTYSH